MGTYDVKWHAYEQAMKADPAWQKLSKAEKAEQFGRYAQGLQHDQIKAANKARGQELSIMFANERQAKQALDAAEKASQGTTSVTASQIDNMFGIGDKSGINRNSLQGMYSDLFGRGEQVPMHNYNLVNKPTKITASSIDEALRIPTGKTNANHAEMQDVYNNLFGRGEQVPMHGYNLVTDPSNVTAATIDDALGINRNIGGNHAEMEDVYKNLFGKGEQVPMHGYNLVTDPAKVSASQIDEALGIGVDNHVLRGLNTDYRHLEALSDYKHALGDKLAKPTEFSPEILDDLTGHGVNKELDAMGDYYRALEKTDDVAGKINWGKVGKWAGIAALAVGAAALIGWGISKLCKKDEAAAEETKPEETVVTPDTPEEVVEPTPVEPEVPVVPVPVEPEEPVAPEVPVEPEVPTEYAAQRGDGIWHIAERHLKDKFANEPENFENLTTSEKNKMILEETLRIAELNNYELVERVINGKKQIVPNPTLKPGDIVKV